MIYSLLGSCRRLGINPAEYLAKTLFERLPKAKTSEVKSLTRRLGSKPNATPERQPTKS